MVEIKIDNTGDGTWWLYNSNQGWKDYCGCENFDEQVVLTGNRDFTGCTEAEWYQNAKKILDDIDCYDEYPTDVSDEVNAKLKEMYDKCRCTEDILVDVIRLLYPEDTFKTGTIRGYSQGDWQDYIVMGDVDTDLLEAMYFGKISGVNLAEYETDAISGFSLAKEIPTEEMSIYELISNYDMTLGELLKLLHDPDMQSLFISVKDEETREDVNEKDCMDKIVQDYEVQYDDVILYV